MAIEKCFCVLSFQIWFPFGAMAQGLAYFRGVWIAPCLVFALDDVSLDGFVDAGVWV